MIDLPVVNKGKYVYLKKRPLPEGGPKNNRGQKGCKPPRLQPNMRTTPCGKSVLSEKVVPARKVLRWIRDFISAISDYSHVTSLLRSKYRQKAAGGKAGYRSKPGSLRWFFYR